MRENLPISARIGCVPYLNARPLLEGLTYHVTKLVPARLFEAYQAGECDAALLSSIDVITRPDPLVVDGVSIASRGEVYSVFLAYTGELQSLKEITLDLSSHTSNALLQIVLSEFYAIQPKYVQLTDINIGITPTGGSQLFIGDPAITLRKRTTDPDIHFLDLGAEWFRMTGLPFVFALWLLRNDFTKKKLLAESLREAKTRGLSNRDAIAKKTADPEFTRRYLSHCIRYDLGEDEKKGLTLFSELLTKNKITNKFCDKLNYI